MSALKDSMLKVNKNAIAAPLTWDWANMNTDKRVFSDTNTRNYSIASFLNFSGTACILILLHIHAHTFLAGSSSSYTFINQLTKRSIDNAGYARSSVSKCNGIAYAESKMGHWIKLLSIKLLVIAGREKLFFFALSKISSVKTPETAVADVYVKCDCYLW